MCFSAEERPREQSRSGALSFGDPPYMADLRALADQARQIAHDVSRLAVHSPEAFEARDLAEYKLRGLAKELRLAVGDSTAAPPPTSYPPRRGRYTTLYQR